MVTQQKKAREANSGCYVLACIIEAPTLKRHAQIQCLWCQEKGNTTLYREKQETNNRRLFSVVTVYEFHVLT